MAIDGKWEITINSPMGAQKAKLELKTERRRADRHPACPGHSQPLTNGKVDGNSVSWSANITSPMPMTLEFTGSVDGDTLSRAASRPAPSAPSPSAAARRLTPL